MKLTIRERENDFVVYDHLRRSYRTVSNFSEIEEQYPDAIQGECRTVTPPLKTPYKVFFDPTNQCNSRCIHCYNRSGVKREGEISLQTVEQLAEQMFQLGICQISIAGGEPFLRSDLYDMIASFRNRNIDVSITTNGLCFSEDKISALLSLNIKSITVSIDGVDRDIYHRVRGVDRFEQLNRNLSSLREAYEGELAMRFSIMKGNCYPQQILEYAVNQGFDCLKVNKTHLLGRFFDHPEFLIDDEQYDALIAEFYRLKEEYSIELELPREKYLNEKSPLRCSAGEKTLYISPQGQVFPCPFIDSSYLFGDLQMQTLEGIIVDNQTFTVDNEYCHQCPAMKKSHQITKKKLVL